MLAEGRLLQLHTVHAREMTRSYVVTACNKLDLTRLFEMMAAGQVACAPAIFLYDDAPTYAPNPVKTWQSLNIFLEICRAHWNQLTQV